MIMDELQDKIEKDIFDCLLKGNIDSLDTILTSDKRYLQEVTSLSTDNVEKVIKEATSLVMKDRFYKGCHCIDSICRGGIPIKGITEITGCSGVGKTQFCLQLSLMVQLGKSEVQGALYICTEEVFPSKRLIQLAEVYRNKYYTKIKFEDNVFIEHLADYEQLRRCLYVRVPQFLRLRKIGLIVIDSIAGVFRSENSDVSYSARSQDFVTIAKQLKLLCKKNKVAIVCVNQVTENLENGKTEPALGLAWSNLVTCRFAITRYLKQSIREFEIIFAPDLIAVKCNFLINECGLVDPH